MRSLAGSQVKQMAEFWRVFPDVLPKFPANLNLVVSFGESRHDTVYRGNYLTAEQVLLSRVAIVADSEAGEGGPKRHISFRRTR